MSELQPSKETTPSLTETAKSVSRYGGDDIDQVILGGITFSGASKGPAKDPSGKVRTKAKKKGYVTGSHGSASSKKKADIRRARANRHKK